MKPEISKSLLRRTALQYRRLLSDEEYQFRNQGLILKLSSFLAQHNAQVIHSFLAIKENREPDLRPLFTELWKKGKQLIVSKTHFESKSLSHFFLTEHTVLQNSEKGIPEPREGVEAELSEIQLILIPLILADKQGFRIGYGGGYYDRFLKETKATKVGLSLGSSVDNIIQRDEWDIPLDHLITPYKTYNYGKNYPRR